ncbi:hypothetical protein DIPPA_03150 [Diplonema papillatum]|nr:hypothetical protein DIPPA_03150 [Diplonema papillatum]
MQQILPGPSGKFVGRALTTTAPANPLDGGAANAHQQATSKLIRQIEAFERDSADVTGWYGSSDGTRRGRAGRS